MRIILLWTAGKRPRSIRCAEKYEAPKTTKFEETSGSNKVMNELTINSPAVKSPLELYYCGYNEMKITVQNTHREQMSFSTPPSLYSTM